MLPPALMVFLYKYPVADSVLKCLISYLNKLLSMHAWILSSELLLILLRQFLPVSGKGATNNRAKVYCAVITTSGEKKLVN